MFSCEYCETFKIIYFEENLPTVASKRTIAVAVWSDDLITVWKSDRSKAEIWRV